SITGCRSFAGDPFTQRGIAFKKSIDFQAARAPRSTAGYLGFAANVITPVRPLMLNTAANVNRIKAAMTPSLNNNTNYKVALDTAKKWLLTPSISSNPTKAVIFLSDGQPTGANPDGYLEVLKATYAQMPGAMPPIYGIFLGKPTPDTIKLSDMSKATGGRFFLIPPDRPDSLTSVVERILNVILRQYQPNSSVVTNNTTVPPQIGRSGPGDFVRLADGTWSMRLDKPVGMKGLDTNLIDMTTELIDVQSGAVQPKSVSFKLRTTGTPETTNKNLPGTQFSVNCVEVPPAVNPVKVAYIRDTDGDGAGDKVFFVFTRPLSALPPSIDEIYWNQAGAGFLNKSKPVLSFLLGSGNTVVVADLTAGPFPKGLTGIPAGAVPVGVLPAAGVFAGQRPPIADSIGPILISAFIRPFDNSKVQPGGELNMDTIIIQASEPIRTETGWSTMLLWSKSVGGKCTDYDHALLVVPKGQPAQDAAASTFTLIVPTGTGTPTPLVGDCVYLNTVGTYMDYNLNVPPVYGEILEGKRPPREIELFRGYPPVVGITADNPGFLVMNNDPRKGDNMDYSNKDAAGKFVTRWIPPAEFKLSDFKAGIPFVQNIPMDIKTLPVGTDPEVPVPLPEGLGTVQVVSTGKYIVDISLFDNNGNFVRKLRQKFGFNGELNNRERISNRGLVSYLVWDLKDYKGQKAGQGVFIWKALFRFENNKEEVRYTRTGVMR
nr:VWA domain-containing protein [Fibrobacterota bacterium]